MTVRGAAVCSVLVLLVSWPAGAQPRAAAELLDPGAVLVFEAARPGADAQASQTSKPIPWYERIRFSGDFRTRYEGFYQDDTATRNRFRMRLRVRLDATINDQLRFQLQLSSGDPGTPVSTNQTFTGFFLPKPVSLDRAAAVLTPKAARALTVGFGKFGSPHTRTQMLWDDDLNVEGAWEQVAWRPTERVSVRAVALQTVVNEVSATDDAYMVAAYGELRLGFGPHTLQVSAADYGWGNPNSIAVASAGGPLQSILTNAVVRNANGVVTGFQSRFNVVDVIAEATLATGRAGYPLRLLAEVARNTRAASDRDGGVWIEAELGEPRDAGTWGASYTYGAIEQDVSPSPFVFSDMPGTNTRLHMLETSYFALPGLSLDVTLHFTKRLYLDRVVANPWLTRLHAGAVLRF